MKPLKIAILTPTFLPKFSGAEIFHHNLALRLRAAGHDPVVVLPRSRRRQLTARGWALPYSTDNYPGNFWSYFKYSVPLAFMLNRCALTRLQRKHDFDVWHAVVLFPAGVCLTNWQQISRKPGLIRPVGDDVTGLPGQGHAPKVEALLRSTLPSAQALVSLSPAMEEDLAALGVNPAHIHHIPNAVDGERFTGPVNRGNLRAQLGLPDDAFVFLCVARHHPQKDFSTLFGAFRRLLDRTDRPVVLAVAGRGAPDLHECAAAAGVGERVRFYEFGLDPGQAVPPTPPQGLVDLYRASDGFVLSSLLEGFSSALVEAMAAGLPVVATKAPGIREVVTDGVTALLRSCGDAGGLADALWQVMSDEGLRHRLVTAAHRTVRAYEWPAITAEYVSLYERLIREKSGGSGS